MKKFIFVLMFLTPFVAISAGNDLSDSIVPDDLVPPEKYTVIQKDVPADEAFPDEKKVSEIKWSEGERGNAIEAKPVGESYFGRGYYKQQKP